MANTMTRYAPRDVVPTRSLIDQLVEGSIFAPSLIDRWVGQSAGLPANLVETDDAYLVQLALPGLDTEKLDIQSLGRELRINGVYEDRAAQSGNQIWNGLPSGEFSHGFTLPAEVASEGAEATYTNGILSITLPKSDHAKVKNIPIKKSV